MRLSVGEKFTRLLVIKIGLKRGFHWAAECRCTCGTTKIVREAHLLTGATQSCGCLRAEITRKVSTTHGATVGGKSPAYRVWRHIKNRCKNRNDPAFVWYGARGITVCPEWDCSFETFLSDMGPPPSSKHSIDRINNNGNYEKTNCRWATGNEQQRNRRSNRIVVVDGIAMCVAEAAEKYGVHYEKFRLRLNRGIEALEAIRSLQQ